MSLMIARGPMPFHGISIYDDATNTTIATINGAGDLTTIHRSPIILLSLDPHVIYGLSHPALVSEALQQGPRVLVTAKHLAHHLYEHGMKAAHGKIVVGQNMFQTMLETFYRVENNIHGFSLVEGVRGFAIALKRPGIIPILLHGTNYQAADSTHESLRAINIDTISDYIKID